MTCRVCGAPRNQNAAFCGNCGTPAGLLPEGYDSTESVRDYAVQITALLRDSMGQDISPVMAKLRERFKVSHALHLDIHQRVMDALAAMRDFQQFTLEFNENVTDAFAGHDTYLEFRVRNDSSAELMNFQLYWDDPETPDEEDFLVRTQQLVMPHSAVALGGTHIFIRPGVKSIGTMEITVENILKDSARFLVEPFRVKIGNPSQSISNTVITNTQISIEGRGVVDASGIGNVASSPTESKSRWLPLRCTPILDDVVDEYVSLYIMARAGQEVQESGVMGRQEEQEGARQDTCVESRYTEAIESLARDGLIIGVDNYVDVLDHIINRIFTYHVNSDFIYQDEFIYSSGRVFHGETICGVQWGVGEKEGELGRYFHGSSFGFYLSSYGSIFILLPDDINDVPPDPTLLKLESGEYYFGMVDEDNVPYRYGAIFSPNLTDYAYVGEIANGKLEGLVDVSFNDGVFEYHVFESGELVCKAVYIELLIKDKFENNKPERIFYLGSVNDHGIAHGFGVAVGFEDGKAVVGYVGAWRDGHAYGQGLEGVWESDKSYYCVRGFREGGVVFPENPLWNAKWLCNVLGIRAQDIVQCKEKHALFMPKSFERSDGRSSFCDVESSLDNAHGLKRALNTYAHQARLSDVILYLDTSSIDAGLFSRASGQWGLLMTFNYLFINRPELNVVIEFKKVVKIGHDESLVVIYMECGDLVKIPNSFELSSGSCFRVHELMSILGLYLGVSCEEHAPAILEGLKMKSGMYSWPGIAQSEAALSILNPKKNWIVQRGPRPTSTGRFFNCSAEFERVI